MKFKQTASMRFRSISTAMKILVDEQKIERGKLLKKTTSLYGRSGFRASCPKKKQDFLM